MKALTRIQGNAERRHVNLTFCKFRFSKHLHYFVIMRKSEKKTFRKVDLSRVIYTRWIYAKQYFGFPGFKQVHHFWRLKDFPSKNIKELRGITMSIGLIDKANLSMSWLFNVGVKRVRKTGDIYFCEVMWYLVNFLFPIFLDSELNLYKVYLEFTLCIGYR